MEHMAIRYCLSSLFAVRCSLFALLLPPVSISLRVYTQSFLMSPAGAPEVVASGQLTSLLALLVTNFQPLRCSLNSSY